ncbi:hypothetical protein Trydic_g6728, partial [Trypoxylus dichotomus]
LLIQNNTNCKRNTPSNTIFCNIQNGTTCDIDNLNKTWSWREDFNYSPILDHRWEDMPTVQVSYLKPITVYKPKQESFRISFSFKGNEVHIFLCDSEYITSSSTYGSCYWIGINANDAPCSTSGITSPDITKHITLLITLLESEMLLMEVVLFTEHLRKRKREPYVRLWKEE